MSPDKRRAPGVFAAIVADPVRKLIAIGLGLLLWLFVNSRITNHTQRQVPLVTAGPQVSAGVGSDRLVVVLPTDRVVGKRFLEGEKAIDRVGIRVSGPRHRVAEIEESRLDLQIIKFLDLDWGSRTSVEFTAADLRSEKLLQDLHVELVPPRVRLEVELIEEQPFQLSLDLVELIEDEQFARRVQVDTAEFAPGKAVVLGRAIDLDRFKKRAGKPFRATVKSAGNERQVTASLELVGGVDSGLRFQSVPILTMQLRPLTEPFDMELPIVVDDLALPAELRGKYEPEAKVRTVRIKVGGNLRSQLVNLREGGDQRKLVEWAAANLRLYVHIARPDGGGGLPAEFAREARVLYVGRQHQLVDRNECLLDETVLVKLRRNS